MGICFGTHRRAAVIRAVLALIAGALAVVFTADGGRQVRFLVAPETTNPAEHCHTCHGNGVDDQERPGIFEQWRASPYGSRVGGLTCVDCHGSPQHDEQCPHSRAVASPSAFVASREAASLALVTSQVDGTVEAEVSVSNSGAGHLLPSGTTDTVMVLQVEAVTADGSRIEATTGPQLSADIGKPPGRYGWLYALTPHSDTRLEPYATHRSRYLFAVATPEDATIVVSLELCRLVNGEKRQCRRIQPREHDFVR